MTYSYVRSEEYSDVTQVLEDGEIKSSKFLLAARSQYFETCLKVMILKMFELPQVNQSDRHMLCYSNKFAYLIY